VANRLPILHRQRAQEELTQGVKQINSEKDLDLDLKENLSETFILGRSPAS
jgi:hypothetical protein